MSNPEMKKITKMAVLFAIPVFVVLCVSLPYTVARVNIIRDWFGINTDIATWINPAIYGALLFFIIGLVITIIRYNAWERFSFKNFENWRRVLWIIWALLFTGYVIWRMVN